MMTHALRINSQCSDAELDNQLRMFWDLESLGIKSSDQSVYEEFERNTVYREIFAESNFHESVKNKV